MRDSSGLADAIHWLMSPAAIRARCDTVLTAARAGRLSHFDLDMDRLDAAAEIVAAVTRERYPSLEVPMHSRWRHFMVDGADRWAHAARNLSGAAPDEVARSRIDLVVISVLLDAGAGDAWRYRDPVSGKTFSRSEGLALASFDLVVSGGLSARAGQPLRVDADALVQLDEATVARAFQVAPDNPLVGLEGRVGLLRRLGETMHHETALFGSGSPRIGGLYDYLADHARDGAVPAPTLFAAVMRGFSGVWPRRIEIGGVNLGDVGRHPAVYGDGPTDGLVPFHKLSQWLTYSLVEPLRDAGLSVTDLDALTGLAEYRNGGLMIDCGILKPKHDAVLGEAHDAGSEIVVEWRALTVALLDRLADRVRHLLGMGAADMPLVNVLEGGTWSAGRRLAAERRPGGGPPIRIVSDGTVF